MDSFPDNWLAEDSVLAAARARGAEVGVSAIPPVVGATLRFLAAVTAARTAVEIGTGTGVSGLWLMRGMAAEGVLTTVDIEPEHHRLARVTFAEAEIATNRVRLITGQALEVLPRLTDGAYDLVHLDASPTDYVEQLTHAIRLLRVGGVLAVSGVLRGRVGDPGARDPETVAVRGFLTAVKESAELSAVLLPLPEGLLAAVRL